VAKWTSKRPAVVKEQTVPPEVNPESV